jgi:hypothetical protein
MAVVILALSTDGIDSQEGCIQNTIIPFPQQESSDKPSADQRPAKRIPHLESAKRPDPFHNPIPARSLDHFTEPPIIGYGIIIIIIHF